MNFMEAIKRANGSAWKDALGWFILNLFLIVMPILATYLSIFNNTGQIILPEPISHGELSLVSISLLGDGIYVITRGLRIMGLEQILGDKKTTGFKKLQEMFGNINFPGGRWLNIIIFIEVIIATIYFMNSFTQNTALGNYQQVLNFRIISTLVVVLVCLLTTFAITLVDASVTNSPPNVQELFNSGTDEWQKKMKNRKWRS